MRVTLTILLFLCSTSHAVSDSGVKAGLKSYLETSRDLKTPADYLNAFKDKLPQDTYEFLKAAAKGHEDDVLPAPKMFKDRGLVYDYRGTRITVEPVAGDHQVFKINQHAVDFTSSKDFNEQYDKVIKALPKMKDTSAWNLLIPQAHADDTIRNGGLGVGLGGVGVLAATLNIWNPYGWAVMVAGAGIWTNGVNQDRDADLINCLTHKDEMTEMLEKHSEFKEAYEKHKPRPTCPKGDGALVDHADTKEMQDYFRDEITNYNQITRYLAIPNSMNYKRLRECMTESADLATYLCINMYGWFNPFLDEWAKAKAPTESADAEAKH